MGGVMLNELQQKTSQAIANIFESGRPPVSGPSMARDEVARNEGPLDRLG